MIYIIRTSLLFFCAILAVGNSAAQSQQAGLFYFGAVEDLGWRAHTANAMDKLLKDFGFNSYRTHLYWRNLELPPKMGEFSFTSSKHAYNVLNGYIKGRPFIRPSTLSAAPVLVLGYGNDNIYADGFRYGSIFPPTEIAIQGFQRYANALAYQYADKVPLFEVWSEWNGGQGSGPRDDKTSKYALEFGGRPCRESWMKKYCWTRARIKDKEGNYLNHSPTMPEHYIRLLGPVYKAIKNVAPNSIILSGVTGGLDWEWTYRFVEEGGLDYTDGYSVHLYWDGTIHSRTPEDEIGLLDVFQEDLKWMKHLKTQKSYSHLNDDIPIFITELGISTFKGGDYHGKAGGERAASELIKFLLMARSRGYIKGIWIYSLRNRVDISLDANGDEIGGGNLAVEREDNFGLYYNEPDREAKYHTQIMKKINISKIMITGKNFVCKIDAGPCRNVRNRKYPLGDKYEVSWTDDKGVRHTASWLKGENDIYIDGKAIF